MNGKKDGKTKDTRTDESTEAPSAQRQEPHAAQSWKPAAGHAAGTPGRGGAAEAKAQRPAGPPADVATEIVTPEESGVQDGKRHLPT